jgi:biotin carboxyl carrier protein
MKGAHRVRTLASAAAILASFTPVRSATVSLDSPGAASQRGGAAEGAGESASKMPGIVVAARSLQPGELIVLTFPIEGNPAEVAVTIFGKRLQAFQQAPGRWRALAGIDLDQKPGDYPATVEARFEHTTVRRTKQIVVRPKRFPTRTLTVSPDFVNPPPAAQAQIERDTVFLRDLHEHPAPERLWRGPFVRPVPDAANSRFGTRSVFNGEPRSPHGGADFSSPLGRPVKAPNAGRVVAARELYFAGNVVIIDHGLGVFSMLAHLSRIDVHEGDEVRAGEIVGLVGATGRVTGPHLHWSLTVSGARVDPLSALALLGR